MPTAKFCVPVASRWVNQFILTCDNELAITFKKHNVCCLYPGTTRALFDLAITWGRPGNFVWRFLYKKRPYRLIKSPCPPGDCGSGAGGTISVMCCADLLPATLHATFSGFLSGTVALNWNGTDAWTATAVLCGTNSSTLRLACTGLGWNLSVNSSTGGCGAEPNGPTSHNCSPLSLSFTQFGGSGCCNGQVFNVTVTT